MRGFLVGLAASLLLALVCSSTAGSSSTTVFRTKVDGYAFALFGDCPDVEFLPPGTVCREGFIAVFREGAAGPDGGTVAPPKTPWSAFFLQHTLTFPADGGEPTESDVRFGFVPDIDDSLVTYDRQHLSVASVVTAIRLSDGTTATFNFHWNAISDRSVYGNNGPSVGDFGLVRHYVDQCSTQVNQAHQKFRVAEMTGTFNGTPVHTYSSFPAGYISFNHFVFIDVTHGRNCA
jgi:hypothetical protein